MKAQGAKRIDSAGRETQNLVHPYHCPAYPTQGDIRKFHRHGKELVLARVRRHGDDNILDHTPH
eukprot:12821886-Heterocapsa_arctica.AAC.1